MDHAASLLRSSAPGLIQRAVTALRGPRPDGQCAVLVRAFTAEIRRERALADWLLQIAELEGVARITALQERAAQYRGVWATFGLAHTLDRLAARPSLFQAVIQALRTASPESAELPPIALAHAA